MARDRSRAPDLRRLLAPSLGANALALREGVERYVLRFNGVVERARTVGRSLDRPRPDAVGEAAAPAQSAPWLRLSFVACVILPFLASVVYFGFLASDQFTSETRFAVRGATELIPGSDALAASGLGVLGSLNVNQDAYIIADYIESGSMIDEISKEIDLRAIFSNPRGDWFARFDPSETPEGLLKYWRKAVTASVEVISGIVTVTVNTFAPDDSVRLAKAIRARCDILMNRLTDRMRSDLIARAEAAVKMARDKVAERRADLERFRNARMVIDPGVSAKSLGETITQLQRDLINVQVNLDASITSLNADSPRIKELQANRQALSDQIAALEAKITSKDASKDSNTSQGLATASKALSEYDRLDIDRTLAERKLTFIEKILNDARADANHHHIYLVSIEDPTQPQSSLVPDRGSMMAISLFAAFNLWLLGVMVVLGVREHAH